MVPAYYLLLFFYVYFLCRFLQARASLFTSRFQVLVVVGAKSQIFE